MISECSQGITCIGYILILLPPLIVLSKPLQQVLNASFCVIRNNFHHVQQVQCKKEFSHHFKNKNYCVLRLMQPCVITPCPLQQVCHMDHITRFPWLIYYGYDAIPYQSLYRTSTLLDILSTRWWTKVIIQVGTWGQDNFLMCTACYFLVCNKKLINDAYKEAS
jgi:hypothetical protein